MRQSDVVETVVIVEGNRDDGLAGSRARENNLLAAADHRPMGERVPDTGRCMRRLQKLAQDVDGGSSARG